MLFLRSIAHIGFYTYTYGFFPFLLNRVVMHMRYLENCAADLGKGGMKNI